VPGAGEITINCIHTLLEIQDKYREKRRKRREKEIPIRDTVFPIVSCCFASPKRTQCFTIVSSFSPFLVLIRQVPSTREKEGEAVIFFLNKDNRGSRSLSRCRYSANVMNFGILFKLAKLFKIISL